MTDMKARLQTEANEEASRKLEVVQKQMTTQMFQMSSAKSEAEGKARTLAMADQEKAEELRKMADKYRAELDKIRREAQQENNQHVRSHNNAYKSTTVIAYREKR